MKYEWLLAGLLILLSVGCDDAHQATSISTENFQIYRTQAEQGHADAQFDGRGQV